MNRAMIKNIVKVILGVILVVAIMGFLVWLFFFQGSHAMPVTGVVVEKIEAGTGYNRTRYILKIDVGAEENIHIVTSARVYNVVAKGISYSFSGPRGGMSYNGVKVAE